MTGKVIWFCYLPGLLFYQLAYSMPCAIIFLFNRNNVLGSLL